MVFTTEQVARTPDFPAAPPCCCCCGGGLCYCCWPLLLHTSLPALTRAVCINRHKAISLNLRPPQFPILPCCRVVERLGSSIGVLLLCALIKLDEPSYHSLRDLLCAHADNAASAAGASKPFYLRIEEHVQQERGQLLTQKALRPLTLKLQHVVIQHTQLV